MQSQLKNRVSQSYLLHRLNKRIRVISYFSMMVFVLTACGGGGGLPDAAPADESGPIVLFVQPEANAIDVPIGNETNAVTSITFTFDEKLSKDSVLASNVSIREVDSAGNIVANSDVILDQSAPLIYIEASNKLIINVAVGGFLKDKTYEVQIKNFYDTLGNLMAVYSSRFSTTSTPTVTILSPANDVAGDIPVSIAQKISVEFDEIMNEASLKAGFKLTEATANSTTNTVYTFNDVNLGLLLDHQIVGTRSLATYSLVEPGTQTAKLLAKTARYTIDLSSTMADLNGNKIVPVSSTFRTGVSDQLGSIPVKPGIVIATTSNDTVTFKNTITWPVANNIAYNLYVSKNGGGFIQIITTPTPLLASSFTNGVLVDDNNVTAGVRYKYAVTAMNIISANTYGPESILSYSGEVVPSITAVPQNLIAVVGPNDTVVGGDVTITWDAVGNNRYKLYESNDAGRTFNTVLLTNSKLLRYSYTPLDGNDVKYQYGLTIINPDTTESVMIKSAIVVPFGALPNVTAQGGNKKVTITWPTWQNVPGATYNVFVKVGTGSGATFSTTPIATNLTTGLFIHGAGGVSNPPLLDSTSYTYGVVTVSTIPTLRTAIQKDSNVALTTTPRPAPIEPANINVKANDGSVTITWDVAIDTNGVSLNYDYSVLQKVASETVFTQVALIKNLIIGNGKATVLATNNISHSYQLRAIDNTVEGAISPAITVIPRLKGSQISAWKHSCVIKAGELWCWGDNTFGQLGNTLIPNSYAEKPAKVTIPTTGRFGTSWIAVATGKLHTCAIRNTGEMYCWGSSRSGALGDGTAGTTATTSTPQLVTTPAALLASNQEVNWTQVVAGQSFTCGIHSNAVAKGQLFCWGNNSFNQLGLGGNAPAKATTPEPVVLGADLNNNWLEIQAGNYHACGIREQVSDNTLWCWGLRTSGQLGGGNTSLTPNNIAEPQQVITGPSKPDWSSIALGNRHSCAVRGLTNTLWCWGNNLNGQLTTQQNSQIYSPVQESSLATDWIKVFANNDQTCGLKKSGAISCWGKNFSGESGDGTLGSINFEPKTFAGTSDWSQLALGLNYTCGKNNINSITPNGVFCWGNAEQYGVGVFTSESAVPVQVGTEKNWFALTAGTSTGPFVLGLRDATLSNVMFAWGNNQHGALGNSDLNVLKSQLPLAEKDKLSWKEISAGEKNVCAILNGVNTLYCWGQNRYIPLEPYNPELSGVDGTAIPRQIGANEWLTIDHGAKHACGIKIDNSLWCWGRGRNGQLGAGSTTVTNADGTVETISPTIPDVTNPDPTLRYIIKVIDPVPGIQWTSVSAGNSYTCAIGLDNTSSELYCWGLNSFGQLGIGINSATNITTTTTKITTDSAGAVISTIESSEKHVPTLVVKPAGVNSWLKVSTGLETSCAITDGGVQNLYCWGKNKYGVLQSPDTVASVLSPELIDGASSTAPWDDVDITTDHVCARRADNLPTGTLWCWGFNNYGQIGNGIIRVESSGSVIDTNPVQVFIGSKLQANYWRKFTTGNDSTCAIKDDGSLWCWGRNFSGQLGTNNAWKATATAVTFP